MNLSYIQNGDLWQVLQRLPLPPDVVHAAHNHHVLELMVVEVGGPQRHHEVPEPDHGALEVSEEADHHVTIEDGHGCLVTVLRWSNR